MYIYVIIFNASYGIFHKKIQIKTKLQTRKNVECKHIALPSILSYCGIL